MLGAVRIGLLAVLMVLIFDRIIPAGREPAFLRRLAMAPDAVASRPAGPALAAAGRDGLSSTA